MAWQWPAASAAPAMPAAGASIVLVPGIQRSSPEFRQALYALAQKHTWDVDGIAIAISLESGFNPAAVNKKTDATGLIQWIPKTAEGLGTTTADLRKMTDVEQVPYIEKFFGKLIGLVATPNPAPMPYDYLLLIYTGNPKYVGADPSTVVSHTGEYPDLETGETTIKSIWAAAARQEAKAQGQRIDLTTAATYPFPQPGPTRVSGGLWFGLGLLTVVGGIFVKTLRGRHA